MPDETATAGGAPANGSGTPPAGQPGGPAAPPATATGAGIATTAPPEGGATAAEPDPVAGADPGTLRSMELLHGVEMSVTIELGRTKLLMRDVLGLHVGSVVELDRSPGAAVDLLVNGTLLARGEVVVVDDELGVRLTEIVSDRPRQDR